MIHFLYYLLCPKTNSIRYIGQTSGKLNKRLHGHFQEYRRTLKLKRQKTYKENWFASLDDYKKVTIHLIEECSTEFVNQRERELISEYKANGCDLTNIQSGGTDNHFHNEETRKKISESKRGSKNPMFGKRFTKTKEEAEKARIAMIMSAKFQTSRKSQEYRDKISKLQNYPIFVLNSDFIIIYEFTNCSQCAKNFGYTRGNVKNAVRHKRQIGKGKKEKFWVVRKENLGDFINDKRNQKV